MMLAEKYQITEVIDGSSSGKFGKLFKGQVKLSGETVLIKALDKRLSDQTTIERLRNEATFSFSTESLPTIYEFYESDDEILLVRNFVEGSALKDTWETLKRKDKLPFLRSLLKELERIFLLLEQEQVIHGDIRPGNIIVSNTNPLQPHLIDFGLAFRKNKPDNRKIIFPLGYAAPELILNQLFVADQRTDIFSLGITIWNLFTNELPLAHPNPSIFTNLQITHPLPDHSSLPKNLYEILNKMCSKHAFKLAPNKMSKEKLINALQEGIEMRYNNLGEIVLDWDRKDPKWSFYQRMSLR